MKDEETIFAEALRRAGPSERQTFLDQACAGNPALRADVEALLRAHEKAAGVLESPPLAHDVTSAVPAALGAAPAPAPAERAGAVIGNYKLLEQIGEGGMGVVFMAEQLRPVHRRVAIKIIKPGLDTKQVIARFEAERQALALMDHAGIAKVFDAGSTDAGRPYFVMELVRGIPITDYCDQHRLTPRERLDLFIQVCRAVQHAHQKGIIHRDLKPTNVLVTVSDDGAPVPKVIDFGIAKATAGQRLTERTLFTEFRQLIGTPLYMSPEQAEMSVVMDVDTRSDVYSLGVLLYELLTGTTPFDKKRLANAAYEEVRRIIREEEPPKPSTRLSSLGATLPEVSAQRHTDPKKLTQTTRGELDWIVMKALEKDRARRYETASGLARDVERYLDDEPVAAGPPSRIYRFRKMVRRNKLPFAAGLSVAAALLIGMGVSLWQANRARAAAVRASAALEDLRATAPAFAAQARTLVAQGRYDEAIDKLRYAARLRPDAPEYPLAQADLLETQLRLREAASAYRSVLKLSPGNARAQAQAELCERLQSAKPGPDGHLSRESLGELYSTMLADQRSPAEIMPVAQLLGEEKKHIASYWQQRLKDLPLPPDKPLDKRLTVRDDGLLSLDLSQSGITDITPLAGMPLGELDVSGCELLTNISALRAMPLKVLNLAGTAVQELAPLRDIQSLQRIDLSATRVNDLSPLRGSSLQILGIGATTVTNLSPLAGMRLKEFNGTSIPALDFSPLAGMPLETCILQGTRVRDLSFLRGMPLKKILLNGCLEIRNLKVLQEIPTLQLLLLPSNADMLPSEEVAAIDALRHHPALKQISTNFMEGMNFDSVGSKDSFWPEWDRHRTLLERMKQQGYVFDRNADSSDGKWTMQIHHWPDGSQLAKDPRPLEGSPATELQIDPNLRVSDLSPIRSWPLESLTVNENPVADLSPLRGMKLHGLWISGTLVSDLSPLEGQPLVMLDLLRCEKLTDLSPLAKMPALTGLMLPPHARDLEPLRKLPHLQFLAFSSAPDRPMDVACRAEDFWKTWDGLPWARRLEASGVTFTIAQTSSGYYDVTIHEPTFKDCSVFKGSNVRRLNLSSTSVEDLTPLRDLPLELLNLDKTLVRDLGPLRGSAMEKSLMTFRAWRDHITDFSPLSSLQNLRSLNLNGTPLNDLEFARNLKLHDIGIEQTNVIDISVLANMPLETAMLDGTPVTDISPLGQCKGLKSITLPKGAQGLEVLRQLPELTQVSYDTSLPSQTVEQVLASPQNVSASDAFAIALRKAKLNCITRTLKDGTWSLNFDLQPISDLSILKGAPVSQLSLVGTPVSDLTPLQGMRLKSLILQGTDVSDLTPLRGMPVTELRLASTKVTDLTPLRGMRLASLQLSGTKVSDLRPLIGMPLHSLKMTGCAEITDLSPLAGMTTLDNVVVPPNATNLEVLRSLPKLTRIGFKLDAITKAPDQSAADFWAEYDRQRAARPATRPTSRPAGEF